MRSTDQVVRGVGRLLRRAGERLARQGSLHGTWIDVGAHRGETTLDCALRNPLLKVYALEPNLSAAASLIGRAPNYFVVPMAVMEEDGFADLNLNVFEAASSMRQMNAVALRGWIGGDRLKVASVVRVPAIRLDTFLNRVGIQAVDYLKIDAQGMDLSVVKSAGARICDISKITLEVDVTPVPLYSGAPSKADVVEFLSQAGFTLWSVEEQTFGQEENLTFVREDNRR